MSKSINGALCPNFITDVVTAAKPAPKAMKGGLIKLSDLRCQRVVVVHIGDQASFDGSARAIWQRAHNVALEEDNPLDPELEPEQSLYVGTRNLEASTKLYPMADSDATKKIIVHVLGKLAIEKLKRLVIELMRQAPNAEIYKGSHGQNAEPWDDLAVVVKAEQAIQDEWLEQTAQGLPHLPDFNKGRPLKTSSNLAAILKHNGWVARHNDMTAESELCVADGRRLGGSEAGQRSLLVDACQRSDVPDAAIDDHLTHLCELRRYHPVRKWLEAGVWDGKPRLGTVLATLNATEPAYAKAVMLPWLIGCVASLYVPSWSSKLVPVLVGEQSFMKSAWVNHLAAVVPGATLDCAINPDKPDDVRRATSCWVAELAELESTTKHEAGSLKAFITRDVDKFRLPYARSFTAKKRQTSFIATVNGSDFLKDQTGNARFAVIEMAGPANIERLNELLGWSWNAGRLCQSDPKQLRQFWLEVKAAYDAGEDWYLDEVTGKQAAKANGEHTDKGPHYEAIFDYHLARRRTNARWFTPGDLCQWHGLPRTLASAWGKALTLMAKGGLVKSRPLRGNKNEYLLPINNSEAATRDTDEPLVTAEHIPVG